MEDLPKNTVILGNKLVPKYPRTVSKTLKHAYAQFMHDLMCERKDDKVLKLKFN